MDLDVLSALSQRDRYERYSRFVKESSLGEETYTIFRAMGEWFKGNKKATEINWSKFGAWFVMVRGAKLPKAKLQVHKEFISLLAEKADEDADLFPLIHGLAKRDYASQIGDLALRIADGEHADFDKILALISEHDKLTGKINRIDTSRVAFTQDNLEEAAAPGLKWRLNALNISAGDVRPGDLIIFGKRPDAGGTTFLASEASCMAEQMVDTDKQVVWINNEERGKKVTNRIVQATIQRPTAEVISKSKSSFAEYVARMGHPERIALYDLPDAHIRDVDAILERHDVGLIILDQGWKIHGFENEGETVRQTLLSNWMRENAKKYAPTITVHQAGGEAEGLRWIPYSMLYGSKTGVPGEADLIIMMGRDFTTGNTRYLWTPKNKMLTPGDPKMRNARWELEIVPDEAWFREPDYE